MVKDLRFYSDLASLVTSGDVTKLAELWSTVLRKRTPPFANAAEYVDRLTKDYRPLVVVACQRKRGIHSLVFLVNNGFPVNFSDGDSTPLQTSLSRGNREAVAFLLTNNADVNSSASPDNGRKAIHVAVSKCDCGLVRMLLTRGADVNVTDPETGNTPIEMAAVFGHLELCRLLLSYDARVLASGGSSSAFHVAASQGHVLLLEVFLPEIDVNTPIEPSNSRALHEAAVKGNYETVDFLIRRGADPSIKNSSARGVLHVVVSEQHDATYMRRKDDFTTVVELLAKHAPLLISVQDEEGDTPLHLAVRNRYHRIVEVLLTNGADTSVTNIAGRTAENDCLAHDTAMKQLFTKYANINCSYISIGKHTTSMISSPLRKIHATAPPHEKSKKRLAPIIVD